MRAPGAEESEPLITEQMLSWIIVILVGGVVIAVLIYWKSRVQQQPAVQQQSAEKYEQTSHEIEDNQERNRVIEMSTTPQEDTADGLKPKQSAPKPIVRRTQISSPPTNFISYEKPQFDVVRIRTMSPNTSVRRVTARPNSVPANADKPQWGRSLTEKEMSVL